MGNQSFVARVIHGLNACDPHTKVRVAIADMFGQLSLGVCRSGDQNRLRTGDGVCNTMQKVVIRGRMPRADGVRLVMDVLRWVVWLDDVPVDAFAVEVKNPSLVMVDPDDGVIALVMGRSRVKMMDGWRASCLCLPPGVCTVDGVRTQNDRFSKR